MRPVKVGVAGKGGSGKSVLACLIAKSMAKRGLEVLLVDADESNRGLYRMLGLQAPPRPFMEELGGRPSLKEKMGQGEVIDGDAVELSSLRPPFIAEADGVKLLVVGKVAGFAEGCACPMGVLSRELLLKLKLRDGQAVVVDLEAGLEHLGRAVDEGLDVLVVVAEPSYESFMVAKEAVEMARKAGLERTLVVLNKVRAEEAPKLKEALAKVGVEAAGVVRFDPLIFQSCLEGRGVEAGEAMEDVEDLASKILS